MDMKWQTINEDCTGVVVHDKELFAGCKGIIKVYDLSSKTLLREIGEEVLVNWVFGLVIHKNTLLATDQTNKLHIFSIDGQHRKSFKIDGLWNGFGLAIHNKKLFICDASRRCIQVVNPDTCELLKTIKCYDIEENSKDRPHFVTSNRPHFITPANNRLYTTECGKSTVKVMDEHGIILGQFSVYKPTGIAVHGKDIIISNYGENQVCLYRHRKMVKVLLECFNPYGICVTDTGQIIVAANKIHISGMVNIVILYFIYQFKNKNTHNPAS